MREETFPIEGGMLPERKFSVRQRNLSAVTLWKRGMRPVKEFFWRSTLVSLDKLSNKVEGISPERLLRDSISVLSEEQLVNERGIPPVRVLFPILT